MPKRILIVNPSPDDLSTLREYLEPEGYSIDTTDECQSACKRVDEGDVDCVILDIPRADVEHESLCSELHSKPRTAGVPIVALIEPVDESAGKKALELGADDFVSRPIQRADLLVRIRMLLRYKELHDDLKARNENLESVNQELAARNQELEQGMEMAHRLQETLLPQQYPAIKNVSFNHIYTPADVIGGDIFQIAELSDERAVIFLSDVSGHGIRAALVTSMLKAVFEHVYLEDKTATEVLQDVNSRFRNIMGGLSPHIFATGFLLIIDGEQRTVSVASAGHVCPFHISKYDMTCEPLIDSSKTGPALGFFHDADFPSATRDLSAGDILLGFTDGVYEVMNREGEMYGLERMRKLVAENARLIPRDLIETVVRETENFRQSRKRPDDVCIVAIEIH